MKNSAIIMAPALFSALLVGGCHDDCERTFARMAPDPAKGQALCSCIVDGLEAEGLSIIETMGNDRGKEIASQCAAKAGVSLPAAG
jgi:hypothetical protein